MTDQVVEQTQDDGAAFESGFHEARHEPAPTKPEAPAPKVEPEAKVEPPKKEEKIEPQTPPDPIAQLRADLDKRLGFIDKLPDRLRNIEGHIGGITSTLKAAATAAKEVKSEGGEAPTKTEITLAAASSAKWKQLKEDFPDWAEAMDERFAEIAKVIPKPAPPVDVAALQTQIGGALTQTFEQRVSAAEARADAARELARVDLKHDGWEETVNTPEFKTWFETQAPDVKALADSPKAKDAIRMLDLYQGARAAALKAQQKKQQNEERLRNAVTPQGAPAAQTAAIDDNDAFEMGFKGARGG